MLHSALDICHASDGMPPDGWIRSSRIVDGNSPTKRNPTSLNHNGYLLTLLYLMNQFEFHSLTF